MSEEKFIRWVWIVGLECIAIVVLAKVIGWY
jgi:hypothetical protein